MKKRTPLSESELRALIPSEIDFYVSSLRERCRKYHMPLEQGRKVIDHAMGVATLTGVLYEARN